MYQSPTPGAANAQRKNAGTMGNGRSPTSSSPTSVPDLCGTTRYGPSVRCLKGPPLGGLGRSAALTGTPGHGVTPVGRKSPQAYLTHTVWKVGRQQDTGPPKNPEGQAPGRRPLARPAQGPGVPTLRPRDVTRPVATAWLAPARSGNSQLICGKIPNTQCGTHRYRSANVPFGPLQPRLKRAGWDIGLLDTVDSSQVQLLLLPPRRVDFPGSPFKVDVQPLVVVSNLVQPSPGPIM